MCRLFAKLSGPLRGDPYPDLLGAPCSLFAQSRADPGRRQSDGWGLCHYVGGRPVARKSERPIFEEESQFKRLLASSSGRSSCVVAHIRHASNPLGLPRKAVIGRVHSQPFHHGRYSFVHNGSLNIPDVVRRELGIYRKNVKGNNDSEVLFWLLVKNLYEARGNVLRGFKRMVSNLWKSWNAMKSKRKAQGPYTGLNIIFSNGSELWTLCKYDGFRAKKDRPLCGTSRSPFFEMCFYTNSEVVNVASEKTSFCPGWTALKDGEILRAWSKGGRMRTRVYPAGKW